MVTLRPELEHAAAEQAELDTELHDHGEVPERERLEDGDGGGRVLLPSVPRGVGQRAEATLGQQLDGREDARPVLLEGEPQGDLQRGLGERLARTRSGRAVVALEEGAQALAVEERRRRRGRGGRWSRAPEGASGLRSLNAERRLEGAQSVARAGPRPRFLAPRRRPEREPQLGERRRRPLLVAQVGRANPREELDEVRGGGRRLRVEPPLQPVPGLVVEPVEARHRPTQLP